MRLGNVNVYEIEGNLYTGRNEYEAVKEAYKMADNVEMTKYKGHQDGKDSWEYVANFRSGKTTTTVTRVV